MQHDTDTYDTGKNELSRSLKTRHVTMIGIGGIIGSGLFAGSANAITTAGPSVLVSYICAGVLIICVCQILGELASSWAGKGSFARFTSLAFGATFGEVIGWVYWCFWVQVITADSVAGGQILMQLLPGRQWIWTLILMLLLCASNLRSVRSYAEAEFSLSLLKVISIVVFIVIGILAICGVFPHSPRGISHLWTEGFFPHGISGTGGAFLFAVAAYCGAESTAIIAAESDNPLKNLKRTLQAIIWRVLIFYIGTLFVATSLISYNSIDQKGTFITVLNSIGLKHTDVIVRIIMLIAIASGLNSAYFVASRMLYNLSATGSAPRIFSQLSSRKVPRIAVLFSCCIGLFGVIGSYFSPTLIFGEILSSTGATMLFIYVAIGLSQIILRKKALEQHGTLPISMWLHPWLAIIVVTVIILSLIWMLCIDSQRIPVLIAIAIAVIFAIGVIIKNQLTSKQSLLAKV